MKFKEFLNIGNTAKKELETTKKYENIGKNSLLNEKESFLKEIETPEGKEKAKSYIKKGLKGAFEKGVFGGVGLISFFLWLIQRGKEKAREYAISELKKSRGEFKSIV